MGETKRKLFGMILKGHVQLAYCSAKTDAGHGWHIMVGNSDNKYYDPHKRDFRTPDDAIQSAKSYVKDTREKNVRLFQAFIQSCK